MTENELRAKVVAQARSWLGCKESNGSHKKIIDLYNSHKPLARGYPVKYTDAWCSTFASAVAIACGLTDIIPTECGCEKHIQLFKKFGSWEENDAYVPKPADYIFYDWDDNGVGECTGAADHIGIVETVNGNSMTIIEGNMSNAVGRRNLKVNARYIRGYGIPNYARKATSTGPVVPPSVPAMAADISVGDVLQFTGSKHYTNANAINGSAANPGKAKVTAISANSKHPYHVIHTDSTSNVYGWVDAADVSKPGTAFKVGDKVKIQANAPVYGKTTKFSSFVYNTNLFVRQIDGDRIVVSTQASGAITGAVDKKYLTKV